MQHEILENGNLRLTIDDDDRAAIEEAIDSYGDSDTAMYEVFDSFMGNTEFEWVAAEDCGAMTDSPLIGVYGKLSTEISHGRMAGAWDGKVWYEPVEQVWGWMDYAVESLLSALLREGHADLTPGHVVQLEK